MNTILGRTVVDVVVTEDVSPLGATMFQGYEERKHDHIQIHTTSAMAKWALRGIEDQEKERKKKLKARLCKHTLKRC
jgi:hypothetical protein